MANANPATIRNLEETIRITRPVLEDWRQGYTVKQIGNIYFEGDEGRANDFIAWGASAVFELAKIRHPEIVRGNRTNNNNTRTNNSRNDSNGAPNSTSTK